MTHWAIAHTFGKHKEIIIVEKVLLSTAYYTLLPTITSWFELQDIMKSFQKHLEEFIELVSSPESSTGAGQLGNKL